MVRYEPRFARGGREQGKFIIALPSKKSGMSVIRCKGEKPMHRKIALAVLIVLAASLHAAPPECRIKGNDIQCDVMTKNGFLLDVHPHRPSVTFTLKRWRARFPIVPTAMYTVTQESQRGTWYRFTDNIAWIAYPVDTYFETWITDCRANGVVLPCSQAFDYRGVNF
jgi:hypothetical protein